LLSILQSQIKEGRKKMKITLILAAIIILLLFIGCGEEANEDLGDSEASTPDIATLVGKVTLEGSGEHSGVTVSVLSDGLSIASSETNAEGNYSIGLKKTGTFTLTFVRDSFVTVMKEINIVEGENSGPEVTLIPGGLIQAAVDFEVQPDGEPKMLMTVVNEADNQKYILEVGRDDKYLLTVPPGVYTVTIEAANPDSKFTPYTETGIEVNIGDVIGLKVRMTTWPYFEAEDATKLTGGMKIREDELASGGKYVIATGAGVMMFSVMFPESGDYIIWGRVLAPDGDSDSFFIDIDVDAPGTIWDVQQGKAWVWDEAMWREPAQNPVIFTLSEGIHDIVIKTREADTQLDKIFITTDRSARPE
jgi:hypothetical protein